MFSYAQAVRVSGWGGTPWLHQGGDEVDRRELGKEAEDAAVSFLTRAGYEVKERNFFCRWGEVDVVAEKGDTVCFVEVRMRSTAAWGDPSHTVTGAKQRRVVKAALHFLQQHRVRNRMVRFDVISVVGKGKDALVEHIPDAFDAGM
ncbi:MAG: YraN family protein [Myxococcota bacterium]